jgi:hypothetical protein
MLKTKHFHQRMSQRGVGGDMIELALAYGTPEQDKYVLGRRETLSLLEENVRQARLLKKILDKGGVVVVADGGALITTYNCTGRNR